MPIEGIDHLFHELLAHQIELEMQNEELRYAQLELTESRNDYEELYNFAPVGYVTVNDQGVIEKANVTAAHLWGLGSNAFIDQPLVMFIVDDDHDIYYRFQRELLAARERRSCELRMLSQGADPISIILDGTVFESIHGRLSMRFAMTDITERTRAEEIVHRSQNELLAQREREKEQVRAELHRVRDELIRCNSSVI